MCWAWTAQTNVQQQDAVMLGFSLGGLSACRGVRMERLHVQVYPGRTALVVSLENITENVYLGNQRSMTITNCLFRMGGAAALLSNKRRHWWTARSAPVFVPSE